MHLHLNLLLFYPTETCQIKKNTHTHIPMHQIKKQVFCHQIKKQVFCLVKIKANYVEGNFLSKHTLNIVNYKGKNSPHFNSLSIQLFVTRVAVIVSVNVDGDGSVVVGLRGSSQNMKLSTIHKIVLNL